MMADTGEKRYSKKESLNRIYKFLEGYPLTDDTPETIPGVIWSEDEAMSKIAELLGGSLPDSYFNDYGEIYTWTGTVTLTGLPSTGYTKITGTFQNAGLTRGMTAEPTQARLIAATPGVYFVDWQISGYGSSAITYKVAPYCNTWVMPQAASTVTPYSSGSAVSFGGTGIFYVSGTNEAIDLRIRPSATAWLKIDTVQLRVLRRL
jgi:hypothetical protein